MEQKYREVRGPGYTIRKPIGATIEDSTTQAFVDFKNETNAKLKKLNDDIKGIKMQLGRDAKHKKKELNILEEPKKEGSE